MSTLFARAPDECAAQPEAFDEVVRRYRRSVTLAAYQITHDIEDARDVAQHVFFQLYRRRTLFAGHRSMDRWLYVVTRNEALNVWRRRQRDTTIAVSSSEALGQLGLEETVLRNERSRRVREMIAVLPQVDRDVIELRYLRSWFTSEIASDLGVPVQRVKRDVERAKWRLRTEILRQGATEDVQ